MFRLDKRKIFLLYHYYLLGKIQNSENEKGEERVIWYSKCLEKEKSIGKKINQKLKSGWEFSSLPPLEKATLIFATYEMLFGENCSCSKVVIDQTINFSKVYLEEKKYKYINKVLDLLAKEELEER